MPDNQEKDLFSYLESLPVVGKSFNTIASMIRSINVHDLILVTSYLYPYKCRFNVSPYQDTFYSLYRLLLDTLSNKIEPKLASKSSREYSVQEDKSNVFFCIVDRLPNSTESIHTKVIFDTLIKIKSGYKNSKFFLLITNESSVVKDTRINGLSSCESFYNKFYIPKVLVKLSSFQKLTDNYFDVGEFDVFSIDWQASTGYDCVMIEVLNFITQLESCLFVFPGGLYHSHLFPKLVRNEYPTVFWQTNLNDTTLTPHTLHITHGYQTNFEDRPYRDKWRNCFRAVPVYDLEELKRICSSQIYLKNNQDRDYKSIITFGRDLERRIDPNFIQVVEEITDKFTDIRWDFVGFSSLSKLESSCMQKIANHKNCKFYEYVPNFKEFLCQYDIACLPNYSGGAGGILDAYLLGLRVFCFMGNDAQSLLNDYSIYYKNYESYKNAIIEYLNKYQFTKVTNQELYFRHQEYISRECKLAEMNTLIIMNEAMNLHRLSGFNQSSVVEIGSVQWNNETLKNNLVEFLEIYQQRPIKDNLYGMKTGHMFFCWFLIKFLNPKYIIESGVYKGQSTWLFEIAAPDAKIFSIEPNDRPIIYRSSKAKYYTGNNFKDFQSIDWSTIDKNEVLCFFDDHYGVDRIVQAYEFGFRHILYDDNYYNTGGNTSHPSGNANAPKACFRYNTKESNFIKEVAEVYYEFPPIAKNISSNPRCQWEQIKNYTKTPLLTEDEIKFNDILKIYQDEAFAYTWLCYIRLKYNDNQQNS